MPWNSSESRKRFKKKNKEKVLSEKRLYNKRQWLNLTNNYIEKRVRDTYRIINPSRKLIFVKGYKCYFLGNCQIQKIQEDITIG